MTFAFVLAVIAAVGAVVLGRRLAWSVFAAALSLVAMAAGFAATGTGVVGWVPLTVAAAVLATIQLLGWMLVDVDRDHLPPTDGATRFARGLAFGLLGAGLVLLAGARFRFRPPMEDVAGTSIDVGRFGRSFFVDSPELVTLCGMAIAAALLATMTALRDDGEVR